MQFQLLSKQHRYRLVGNGSPRKEHARSIEQHSQERGILIDNPPCSLGDRNLAQRPDISKDIALPQHEQQSLEHKEVQPNSILLPVVEANEARALVLEPQNNIPEQDKPQTPRETPSEAHRVVRPAAHGSSHAGESVGQVHTGTMEAELVRDSAATSNAVGVEPPQDHSKPTTFNSALSNPEVAKDLNLDSADSATQGDEDLRLGKLVRRFWELRELQKGAEAEVAERSLKIEKATDSLDGGSQRSEELM
ncbi:hypothetical protein LTR37_018715 [Vermiconidia calcicola]|uniref:Uncharacterized protein n=1 Tax=Vermiconidia calcicola TaxID=1690605 RepID=A0ACC3MGG7_9PEZI|nr:hypothetical protein LTR37_018715 [Vermiconidia calcicola]